MKYIIVATISLLFGLLLTTTCLASPKFREGMIVTVVKDDAAFDNDALFYSCDKVKLFRIVNYVHYPYLEDTYYVIMPTTSNSCQFGAKVNGTYLKEYK